MSIFNTDQIAIIVQSQLDVLLWSEGELIDEDGNFTGETWDGLFTADDATPELRQALTEELEELNAYCPNTSLEFVQAVSKYLNRYDLGQFGHDLALTRNGHGAGFWDRGLGETGNMLTSWAKSLGCLNVFKGSDSVFPEWAGKFHAE